MSSQATPNLWEQFYQQCKLPWSNTTESLLAEYQHIVPEGNVLDLGCGTGRNAIYFAAAGYPVTAIDLSHSAIQQCKKAADGLERLEFIQSDITEFQIEHNNYALIISSWTLPFITQNKLEQLIKSMLVGLSKGGLLYVNFFSEQDPSRQNQNSILQEHTGFPPVQAYYSQEQILSYFYSLNLIACLEGVKLDLSHGTPHFHGIIEYLGQKS